VFLINYSSRSLFIWRPKEKSEPVEKKDESKIIICGGAMKKRKGKFRGESDDDSEDDGCVSKGKNFQFKKAESKSAPRPRKVNK